MSLKDEILANPFVERLRNEMMIDHNAFGLLCEQLGALANEWRNEKRIDKQIAQELYGLTIIVKGAADSLRAREIDIASELDEMAIEIESLILECLA